MSRTLVAAAIIGGGAARRFGGAPKHLLEVEGQSIAARQLSALRVVFDHVFVVARDPAPWMDFGVQVVTDEFRAAHDERVGPLAGIEAALRGLPSDKHSVVCVACDMPFLEPAALQRLRDESPDADVVMPRVAGHPEPLFARYGRAVLPTASAQLQTGDYKVSRLLDGINVAWLEETELRRMDPTLRFLCNVNRPEDLAALDPSTESS